MRIKQMLRNFLAGRVESKPVRFMTREEARVFADAHSCSVCGRSISSFDDFIVSQYSEKLMPVVRHAKCFHG